MARMGAIIDLWKSERGLIMVALIAAATTLTAVHIVTVDQWLEYTKWIFVTYVAGKTVTSSVALATTAPTSPPPPQLPPALGALLDSLLAPRGTATATPTEHPAPAATTPHPPATTPHPPAAAPPPDKAT